jgi:hypothetical protein
VSKDTETAALVANQLEFIQFGRETKRYHGLPMLDHQRVDSHLYGQMSLVPIIVGPAFPDRIGRLLLHVVYDGDIAEWRTGDMPATLKRALPDYDIVSRGHGPMKVESKKPFRTVIAELEDRLMGEAGLNCYKLPIMPQDKRVIKLADAAEGVLHCTMERFRGNAHPRLMFCFYEFWKYLTEDYGLDSTVWHIENDMQREHGEAGLRSYLRTAWTEANGGKW